MTKRTIAAIVAMDEDRVIGRDGALPWHLPEDLAHFRALTQGHIVVMGRKTWDSLPPKFRPLPNRTNIVVSRNPECLGLPEGTVGVRSIDEAVKIANEIGRGDQRIWFIGGAELYSAALPICDELHLTLVHGIHDGDARFPVFEQEFTKVSSNSSERCTFSVYRKGPSLS